MSRIKYKLTRKSAPEEGPSIKINCLKLTDDSKNLKSQTEITKMLTSDTQKEENTDEPAMLIDTMRPVKSMMASSKKYCGANCKNCARCNLSAAMIANSVTVSGKQRPFSVVYDEMHIENDATPMGLGMEADDTIAILPSLDLFLSNPSLREGVVKLTSRKDKSVSLGLNVSIGEEVGGLPYPRELIKHDPSCLEGPNLSSLCQMITNAERETSEVISSQTKPTCLSGISHLRVKIEANEIAGICDLLSEVVSSLQRCQAQGTHHPDYSNMGAVTTLDPCTRVEDILSPVLHTNQKTCFSVFVETNFYDVNDQRLSRMRESLFYVGPVRNSTPWNYLSALPIVQLAPFVSTRTSIDELAEAWKFYVTKENFEILEDPTYLLYNEKRIPLGKNISLLDVIDMDMKKHYFCLPPIAWKDEKSVDRLMEFIEGGDTPDQGKEKKKKKRKKAASVGITNGGPKKEIGPEETSQADSLDAKQDGEVGPGTEAEAVREETPSQTEKDESVQRLASIFQDHCATSELGQVLGSSAAVGVEGNINWEGSSSMGEKSKSESNTCVGNKALIEEISVKTEDDSLEKLKEKMQEKAMLVVRNQSISCLENDKEEVRADEGSKGKAEEKATIGQKATTSKPFPSPEPSPEKEEDPLATELREKEAKLQQLWNSEVGLVETKGKEMSALISAVDQAEDEKHAVMKKVAEIDAQMRELQISKVQMIKEMEAKNQKLEKMIKKRSKLEKFIEEEICRNKKTRSQLEKEVREIKLRLEENKKSQEMKKKFETLQPENQKLLEYINRQIEAKEKELECPVCMEVASIPIFCCDDQHIICSDCRPKVRLN